MRRIAVVLMLCLKFSAAKADETITKSTPIDGLPFQDYRITSCSGVSGLGWISFGAQSSGTGWFQNHALSDFCFDMKKGKVFSAARAEKLSLVAGPGSLAPGSGLNSFKALNYGGDTPPSFAFVPYPAPLFCDSDRTGLYAAEGYNLDYGTGHSESSLLGFSRGTPFPNATLPIDQKYGFSFQPIWGADDRELDASEVRFFAIWASASNTDGRTSLVIEHGDGSIAGEATGQIDVNLKDGGEITLSGEFQYKNAQFAGLQPDDFVSGTARIVYMRGFLAGEDGKGVFALGIARGTYVDASGNDHNLWYGVSMNACVQSGVPFIIVPPR